VSKQELSSAQKRLLIEEKMGEVLEILGLDTTSGPLQKTAFRIAKMYVDEVFDGLKNETFPTIELLEQPGCKGQLIVLKEIACTSFCEHHFVPMVGTVSVAYLPDHDHTIGFSKIHEIVRHIAHRPQIQERLTSQIADALSEILKTENVAVFTSLTHFCVIARGQENHASKTETRVMRGLFQEDASLREALFVKE